ncbi:hypothetical protein AQUSIP_17270 [Aquicella siphonis]|uniref:Uncharacterized protein n=1 Tax=Aquicella siphonis TaxID=254247 RepID=A0A5E4PIM2_9COXI|nr:hypothetical protein [Aquicella siphonis]VVC76415.1 hypothetical protein AQUSIP_17270 [Aquicella siphonis]
MTTDMVLIDLFERIAASKGAAAFINTLEINQWPSDLVMAIKSHRILEKASSAKSAICPGCERSCMMPVNTLTNQSNITTAFIVCDKESGINRVPISLDQIDQWQASGYLLAKLIAKLLDLPVPINSLNPTGWEIGIMRGSQHSSYLTLTDDIKLLIQSTGKQFSLIELISFANGSFKIDKTKIMRAVNKPATSAGFVESITQRRKRIQKRVNALANQGHKNPIQIVAKEEGITPRRIHQLLEKNNKS